MIHLELEFTATHCNSWPSIQILGNQTIIWQGIVEQTQYLDFFLPQKSTHIEIVGLGKSQGENNVWDTKVDDNGRIVEDKTLALKTVKINTIDMKQAWIDRLPGIKYGVWYENTTTEFTIKEPVIDWIIQTKFIDRPQDKSIMYNNFDTKWNYSVLQDRIASLKNKLNA